MNCSLTGTYRDTMALAASYNDIADLRGDKIPFPKISLGALAAALASRTLTLTEPSVTVSQRQEFIKTS
jgi:hypothetical protein